MALIYASLFSAALAAAAADPVVVNMNSLGYAPKRVEIQVGEAVVWKNVAYTDHYATADDGKTFDIGPVAPKGESKPVVFTKAGEFGYHCKVHGKSMHGTIVVH